MGELREVEIDTRRCFEYRMTTREALRSAEAALWIGAAVLLIGIDISMNHKSAASLYFIAAAFLVIGIASFVQWRSSIWRMEHGYASRARPGGTIRKVDLTDLARIRIMTKWCSIRGRQRNGLLIPSPMLQHSDVVLMIISGVRTSQQRGQVDIDAATAVLLSSSPDALSGTQTELSVGAPSRGISPVINRVINVWMTLVGVVIVLSVLLVLILKLFSN